MKSLGYRAALAGLALLAFIGATSYVGWLTNMWQLRFKHLGQSAVADIAAAQDPFRILRKAIADLVPAASPGRDDQIILAYNGQDLPTPTRIETFFIAYPLLPRTLDTSDPQFMTSIQDLPKGGLVISDPPLKLPREQFEERDGHGFFVYVRR